MKSKSEKMRTAQRVVTLVLLLGMGLGQLVAQPLPAKKKGKNTREDDPGYVMKKSVNAEGNKLTLESYVTGESVVVQSAMPTDLCLVLDASTSMNQNMSGSAYLPKTDDYSYNDCSSTYYYKDGDSYYQVQRTSGTVQNVYSPRDSRGYTYSGYGSNQYYYFDGVKYYLVTRSTQSGYSYSARTSRGYSYDDYGTNTYYYKDGDKYYLVTRSEETVYAEHNDEYSYDDVHGLAEGATYYYKDGNEYYEVSEETEAFYTARESQGYSFETVNNGNYYYLYDDNYYKVEGYHPNFSSRRYLCFMVGNTRYFIRSNGGASTSQSNGAYKTNDTDAIWTGVLHDQGAYYRLSYTENSTKHYLSGSTTTTTPPTTVTSSSGTIWTGSLYLGATYRRLQYTKGGTTYYLTTIDGAPATTTTAPTNVATTGATIWTGVLYNKNNATAYLLSYENDEGVTVYLTNSVTGGVTDVAPTDPAAVTSNNGTIWTGVLYNYGNATCYALYYEKDGERIYLRGTDTASEMPTDVLNNNNTIWSGTLYTSSNRVTKFQALVAAADAFIDVVKQQAYDNPDAEGNPADHRISVVKFASPNYNDDSEYTNTNPPLTEGNDQYYVYVDQQHQHEQRSYTEVLKNFRSVTDDANVNELKMGIESIIRGPFTSSDMGMRLAVNLFDEDINTSYYSDGVKRNKVAVLFTDGVPCHETQPNDGMEESVANSAIALAKQLKDQGYMVYTIGVFTGNETDHDKALLYMSYVSSNYPSATSLTSPGTQMSDQYFQQAVNPAQLESIFKTIAQESAKVEYDIDERTVVQDVISEYFKLPTGTIASDIVVKTDTCTGFNGTEPVFSGAPVTESYAVTITTYTDKDGNEYEAVQVQGFDFGTHWVGKNSENEPHGRKLIIEIPIEAKPGASEGGIHPTNLLEGSTIYPNGDTDNPFEPFPEPKYYVKKLTWIEHTIADPGESAIKLVDGVYEIYSAEGLAWFASIVCGYNGNEGNPNAKAKLMNDVDMSRYIWAPIGGWALCNNVQTLGGDDYAYTYPKTHGFSGEFNGDGHVVRNLNNDDPVSVPQAGMFGYVNAGTVKNTFVVGCDFQAVVGKTAEDGLCTGVEGHFGIIADTVCNGGVIYNCEAEGVIRTHNIEGEMYGSDEGYTGHIPVQDPTKAYIGGLVGLIGRDKTGAKSTAKVHSCISVATLAGYSMGGCVNEVGDDSDFQNSFSYPLFLSWLPAYGTDLGGLVAVNKGKIENCYLRNRANASAGGLVGPLFTGIYGAVEKAGSDKSRGEWHKGLLVGWNKGSASYIYVPEAWKECDQIDEGNDAVCFVGYKGNEASPVGWYTETETPYLYKHHDNRVTNINGTNDYLAAAPNDRLLQTLNSWVSSNTNCTKWFRTTADGINNDYPVLKIKDLQCVASDDQIVLFYGKIDPLLTDRVLMTDAKAGDVICIYENAAVTETNYGTTLYINEDVAITQEQNLVAYVGITLDNSANAGGVDSDHPYYEFGEDGIDWHMFSTSLSNAPLGVEYTDATEYGFLYGHPEGMPYYRFKEEGSEENGYFPSHVYGTEYSAGNTTDGNNGVDYYHDWDYYCWDESSQHYINFKRNSASHWYESFDFNGVEHSNIPYVNETNLVPGKGYMLATATETFLQCRGTLNNGNVSNSAVTYTNNPYCVGYNLIGNPYQSYLDFDKFAAENGINTYVILDEDNGYQSYTATSTTRGDLKYINMHQGFFVKVNGATPIKFTNDMRNITASSMSFRGEDKTYPYLKLTMTEGNGMRDYATVEFNRPELGGGEKLKDLRMGNAQIYLHYDDNSYSTFFATNDVEEVPVRFATSANGTYSLNWEVSAGDFEEMYLIDNLTGNQVDMLNHSEYKFEGRSSDYASRFKVVFATVEEEEQETESENFAFEMDGNLVVNGKGSLAMYDVTGRLVYSTELTDTQSTLALPQTVGLYIVRLAGSNGVKVQKVVLK